MKIRAVYAVRSTDGKPWSSSVPFIYRHLANTRKEAITWAEQNPYTYRQTVDPLKFVQHSNGSWYRINSLPADKDLIDLLDAMFPKDNKHKVAEDLQEKIGQYWDLAVQEGREDRTTDITEGAAAQCWAEIQDLINQLKDTR